MENIKAAIGDWTQQVKSNASWLVALGAVTLVAGLLSMGYPWASGLAVTVFIGIVMTIAGVARTVGVFKAGSFGQGALAVLGGILTFVAGVILVARPNTGLASLTLLLGGYLLIDGISGALLAFQVKPAQGWGWMLFSAVMGLLLGLLLLWEWPLSGLWAIGTLVGINLFFSGWSMISMGLSAKKAAGAVGEMKEAH
ncbi:MAG: DUF308 domain-containing protein [Thermoanaerobaculia bacterium]